MTSELAIDARSVAFGYTTDSRVIDIDALQITRGERVFVMGPSGSGKSTLLALMTGILQPTDGALQVLGNNLSELRPTARDRIRADHIGYVFQSFNLVPYLTVAANITLPCRFSARRRSHLDHPARESARLMAELGLDIDLANRLPGALSVGQQQRVAVARALIGKPDIVVCDEPTSALDRPACSRFMELLAAQCEAQNTTLVFVSHDESLATRFDRTLSLPTLNRAIT